jgi:hypothetical protein
VRRIGKLSVILVALFAVAFLGERPNTSRTREPVTPRTESAGSAPKLFKANHENGACLRCFVASTRTRQRNFARVTAL